jgi:hypothetical protein
MDVREGDLHHHARTYVRTYSSAEYYYEQDAAQGMHGDGVTID